MRIFARIEDGIVAELIATEQDVAGMFHAALRWVDASDAPGVGPGWRHDDDGFHPPAPSQDGAMHDAAAHDPVPAQE